MRRSQRITLTLFSVATAVYNQEKAGRPLLDAVRQDDTAAVQRLLKAGADVNTRDDQGATALMHAALYASEECVKLLLDQGADLNATTPGGSTALMWATGEESKVRLLLARGADRSMKNKNGQTALHLAVRRPDGAKVARLLASSGQNVQAVVEDGTDKVDVHYFRGAPPGFLPSLRSIGLEPAQWRVRGTAPLYQAGLLGDGDMVRRMLDAGADAKGPVEFVTLKVTPLHAAAYGGNLSGARHVVDRGADVNAKGAYGYTPLMMAAGSYRQDKAMVRWLLDKGADAAIRDDDGRTALDWALTQGETGVARLLRDAGAKPGAEFSAPKAASRPAANGREAAAKALALLQPIGPAFFKKYGCISCHNQSLEAMAVKRAREKGVPVDASLALHPTRATLATWSPETENLQLGVGSVGGFVANVSYGLVAMAEEGAPANAVTDAAALCIARYQEPDGSWNIPDIRPPLGISRIKWTALTIRGAGAYMPPGRRHEWNERLRRGAAYLRKAQPVDTQDAAFQLLGLKWSGAPAAELKKLGERLTAMQRPDGGWSQLETMSSDAYATGQAMYALHEGIGMSASAGTYQKGVRYLLGSQIQDGSWFVRRRGFGFQPYSETGFPHGRDQFISAAATSWAVIALSAAVER